MVSTFLDSRMKTSLNEEKVGCYATWECRVTKQGLQLENMPS